MRRRLRLVCSSDDEEEEEEVDRQPQPPHQNDELFEEEDDAIEVELNNSTLNLETVTLNSSNHFPTTNPNPSQPIQLEISDDDFIDVPEDLSPPSPPSPPPAQDQSFQSSSASRVVPPSTGDGFDCPISGFLRGMGLKLRREWLDSCIRGLESSAQGFASLDIATKAKLCFGQFLDSDMNFSGGGVLPENVHNMHLVDLAGPFVLQVDEVVNISCPLRNRYQNASSGPKRCLKLSMTDGVQRVFGMEYRPIKSLEVLAPAGMKVAIRNVNIRHGLLMLVPEVIEVLGGSVEELEAARQRLVCEVNKPPRGKRTRTGTVPSLATRATRAAWQSSDGTSIPGHTSNSTPQAATSLQPDNHTTRATRATWQSLDGISVPGHTSNSTPQAATYLQPDNHTTRATRAAWQSSDGISVPGHSSNSTQQAAISLQLDNHTNRAIRSAWPSDGTSVPGHTLDSTPHTLDSTPQAATSLQPDNHSVASCFSTSEMIVEEFAVRSRTDQAEHNASSTADLDVEDIHMVDEIEHPLILSGDREIPFTYLSSLSAKWAAMEGKAPSVEGKIKCILTGVKGFQYKQRTTFELRVYVDDGSLISEVLIEHNVVHRGIGYSPEEVSAALASSDRQRAGSMKETLKQFQIFLLNFEGTMVVQINSASSIPTAIEMNQGCPASDAWLLLRRLKPSNSTTQPPQNSILDPISLSP